MNTCSDKISVSTMTEFPIDLIPEAVLPLQKSDPGKNVKQQVVTVVSGQGTILLKLSPYLIALRPWSFTASLGPVALGSCLAYKWIGIFSSWIFVVACVCALSVHAAGNLVNTYFDFTKGVDSKKSDDRTLVDHILMPGDVATMGAVCYFVGCIGLLILSLLSSTPLHHLALVYFGGLSASFLYTGGLGLKYIGLGDVAVMLTFGPLTVLFAFMSQGGVLTWFPLLYAIPLALNTGAILHANNTRDVESDREAGIITLAILAGKSGSYAIFVLLLFIPYVAFVVMAANVSRWFILPLSTVLYTFSIERQFRRNDLFRLPKIIAKLNFILSITYVAACTIVDRAHLPGLS